MEPLLVEFFQIYGDSRGNCREQSENHKVNWRENIRLLIQICLQAAGYQVTFHDGVQWTLLMHCSEFSNLFTISGHSSPGFSMLLTSMVCTCNSSSEDSFCTTRVALSSIARSRRYLGLFMSLAKAAFDQGLTGEGLWKQAFLTLRWDNLWSTTYSQEFFTWIRLLPFAGLLKSHCLTFPPFSVLPLPLPTSFSWEHFLNNCTLILISVSVSGEPT